jgi:hypothetical protein
MSADFAHYQPALLPKIPTVSATKIWKRPIYCFFVDYNGKYFPPRCMVHLGSTAFHIWPEAAKSFSIAVISRLRPVDCWDGSVTNLKTENLFTVPLGILFGNHQLYNNEDHPFELITTSGDYDALIPAWYFEKQNARKTTTSHLHFPHFQSACYNHGKIHPEYSVT